MQDSTSSVQPVFVTLMLVHLGGMLGVMTSTPLRKPCSPSSHLRKQSHGRERTITDDTYGDAVSRSPEINRARFARFIARVLADARDRGMNDAAIYAATTVSPATFHRWQRGNFTSPPGVDKITAFCEGLGVPPSAALRALGADEGRDDPEPDPPMDPDVRRILRALVDPSTSDAEKMLIKETLKMLATRVTAGRRR